MEDEFAKNGSAVVPALRSKLAATERELTIRDIVAVFAEMQRQGSYDVKGDENLMRLVEERVAGMQGLWKSSAQKMLEAIQGHPQE